MKKKLLFILAAIPFFPASFPGMSHAAISSGCLNCHQYAGLVISKKDGGFRAVHIDAERYFTSPHGELDCRDCHVGVSEMPPKEKPAIDCRTRCHKGKKEKALVEAYPLGKLHEGEQSMITYIKDSSPCKICHELYPHSRNKFTSAALNRHAALIVCEVCHLDRKGLKNVGYGWIAVEEVKFKGSFYGSFYDDKNKKLRGAGPSISRIGIFSKGWFTSTALMKSWDSEKASNLGINESGWNSEEVVIAMNYFHEGTMKMVTATACSECHRSGGLIDFSALGFSDERRSELENMRLKRTMSNYNEFHMPNIFGR
ncbi:MAG: hypothetical protein RQ824_07995 [bacterium]|nr:hypothetical protein [bacterium]